MRLEELGGGEMGGARTNGVYWKCSVSRVSACRAESAISEAVKVVVANYNRDLGDARNCLRRGPKSRDDHTPNPASIFSR